MKIFFSGIGGSGVSALACFMADKGHSISGSDRAFDANPQHPVRDMLQAKGIAVVSQNGDGIDKSIDLVVFSTAVEPDRPEVLKAKELGIRRVTRPDYLAEMTRAYKTIAVAGTSGKSTVSGMLAFLMRRFGLSPNFIGGGRVKQFKTASNPGNSITGDSEYLIIEACESDGTIVHYRSEHTIILNLEFDHNPVEETARMFQELIKNTSNKVFMNADDADLGLLDHTGAITFSADDPSDYRATDIAYGAFGSDFTVNGTRFSLPLPGRHNIYNALSCIALLGELGVPLKDVAGAIREFEGLERRFDIHLHNGKKLVIDDYAHNPHKIAALMRSVKAVKERVCYIFQPHGFGPMRMLKEGYCKTFTENLRDTDHLILLPIFYEGGTATKDISSRELADMIKANGKSVEAIESRRAVLEIPDRWDAYVIFGARDETLAGLARDLAAEIMRRDLKTV